MKKNRDRKLQLHRDTLSRLEPREVKRQDLAHVAGGGYTSCIGPDCACGGVIVERQFGVE